MIGFHRCNHGPAKFQTKRSKFQTILSIWLGCTVILSKTTTTQRVPTIMVIMMRLLRINPSSLVVRTADEQLLETAANRLTIAFRLFIRLNKCRIDCSLNNLQTVESIWGSNRNFIFFYCSLSRQSFKYQWRCRQSHQKTITVNLFCKLFDFDYWVENLLRSLAILVITYYVFKHKISSSPLPN